MNATRYQVAPSRDGDWIVKDRHGNVYYRGARPLAWLHTVASSEGAMS